MKTENGWEARDLGVMAPRITWKHARAVHDAVGRLRSPVSLVEEVDVDLR